MTGDFNGPGDPDPPKELSPHSTRRAFSAPKNGALDVTEYFTEQSHYLTGAVVRVALNADASAGARTVLGAGVLHSPNGLAIGDAAAVYVSNFSISAGGGEVMRVNY